MKHTLSYHQPYLMLANSVAEDLKANLQRLDLSGSLSQWPMVNESKLPLNLSYVHKRPVKSALKIQYAFFCWYLNTLHLFIHFIHVYLCQHFETITNMQLQATTLPSSLGNQYVIGVRPKSLSHPVPSHSSHPLLILHSTKYDFLSIPVDELYRWNI